MWHLATIRNPFANFLLKNLIIIATFRFSNRYIKFFYIQKNSIKFTVFYFLKLFFIKNYLCTSSFKILFAILRASSSLISSNFLSIKIGLPANK